ncbi:hypothetical protein LDENG_00266760 [Lucifuga dentata]|nr:hypothetical protein LDENG_00266760 [Lucifuga dentata]
MGSLNLKEVLVFLDDLILFSDTLEEHEERLLRVFNRLKEFGLKLSPEKCHFFIKSVRYLGHVVSENGIETDPDKISALTTWPRPKNIAELKSFLGFTGYYHRFVKDYSKITKPLNDLTVGYVPAKRSKHVMRHLELSLKNLTSAPVLGFADPRKPYILHTDVSSHGLSAALYQEQDGQLRVIAYASRGLSNCEHRYPTHKLEFLALKWAITDTFSDYLYGVQFTVMTDNNPLTYVLTSAKLDATGHRWLAALSNFDFKIQYRAGKRNQDADGLSRHPHVSAEADDGAVAEDERVRQLIAKFMNEKNEVFSSEAIKATCERHQLNKTLENQGEIDHLPVTVECLTTDRISQGQTSYQLVLPEKYRQMVLESLHDTVGHMGFERTVDLVRARFYWPGMNIDVEDKVRNCERCIRCKARAEKTAPLVNIKTSRPRELVCMDYLSLEPDGHGTKNILVITGHFTKFAVAVPTPDQKEKTVAKALLNNFLVHYEIPERLHSDQGHNFESAVIKNLSVVGYKEN